jgi:hypothetical protein
VLLNNFIAKLKIRDTDKQEEVKEQEISILGIVARGIWSLWNSGEQAVD